MPVSERGENMNKKESENREKVEESIDLCTDFKELGLKNNKQLKFVNDFLFTDNVLKSGRNAGYSDSYAKSDLRDILEYPYVKTYISEKRDEIYSKLASEKIAEEEEVLEFLTAAMRGELKEEVVLTVGNKDRTRVTKVEKIFSGRERIKAAETIGKKYGMWTDKVSLEADVGVEIIDDIE